ncbi:MAG TPA: globin domain-containing protein [Acidimicrobiales bacterium]
MLDAQRLRQNWHLVAAHGDQVPLFFYSSLFLSDPDMRDMFPVSMAAQRDRLVAALAQLVTNLDALDAVGPLLRQLGRDHRRFGVARGHYAAVGDALLATLEHFSGPAWSDELARDWAAAYQAAAQVMIDAADAAGEQPSWWDLAVGRVERRTVDVTVLTVAPHAPLAYRAGQSVAIEVPTRPRLWRYYTPATLPRPDGSFELHVRVVPGGPVSTAMVQGIQCGDVLRAGAPVGERLTLGPDERLDLLLLAGGTGLAPMKALIEQLRAEGGPRRTHLFWGVRRRRELYDLAAMQQLAEGCDWLRLVPCVSQEPAPDGRVETGTVLDVALRHGPWADHEVYVCGSPAMVRATVDGMRRAGTPGDLVRFEDLGSEEAPT